jgi:hypothetical protein
MVTMTAHTGNNANLLFEVSKLYIPDNAKVADVTYGKGAFWTKTDISRFELLPSDKYPKQHNTAEMDFRNLTYSNASIDVVVLDPPYIHSPGNHMTDKNYNNKQTDDDWRAETESSHGMYHKDIIDEFYRRGMQEAKRVLCPSGRLMVKCKDEVESGTQRWSHIEIHNIAVNDLGFYAKDLFVLVPTFNTKTDSWKTQHHARKNHSFLWIFDMVRR